MAVEVNNAVLATHGRRTKKPLSEPAGSSWNEGHIFLIRFTSLIRRTESECDPDCCRPLRRLLRLWR